MPPPLPYLVRKRRGHIFFEFCKEEEGAYIF
jgi:hypothetical protein